jgi:2-keto-4-pentenoate hydratase
VSVGSCCGLAQVLPGQILTARLGGLGPISLRLC